MTSQTQVRFDELPLSSDILKAISDIGYEVPSPIQAECIPLTLEGGDLIGQAQTGTGKTAAFALPTLSQIELNLKKPQICVICPTRELAIQVAEAFSSYAKYIKGFRVLPIYGGQPYPTQLKQLERGVHVVVGTPGRIMDHMRRGSLKWDSLKTLVLDEADEMLRMGFMEDVEWILERMPKQRQIALFSATMPSQIKKIAERFLNKPQHVQIKSKAKTASTIEQLYLKVSPKYKLDALTRVLESENNDAVIIFSRTKVGCDELARKLSARGFAAEAIHGDMQQAQRERMVQQLKDGKIDIVVATDVAARGLDVERISHVINYDIPNDPEAYVHRIGRTGRAGREGRAISFITPREGYLLKMIERRNSTTIERLTLPSIDTINDQRTQRFIDEVQQQIMADEHKSYQNLIEQIQEKHNVTGGDIAAAMASILFKDKPLLLSELAAIPEAQEFDNKSPRGNKGDRGERRSRRNGSSLNERPKRLKNQQHDSERYVIHVGRTHGVTPKNIVGAIANEAELDSKHIGEINLLDDVSTVDLPKGMPKEVLSLLKKVRVCGKPMQIELAEKYQGKGNLNTSKKTDKYKSKKRKPRD